MTRPTIRKDSHTASMLTAHMVLTTKYRGKVLKGRVAIKCESYIREICEELDITIIEMSVQPDHVHLFIQYPPKLSTSKIAEIIKANSSRKLRTHFPHLKKWCKKALWAVGCFHGSVGQGFEVVEKYISNQGEGSDKILGDMRKGVNAETQREALEMSRAAGLSVMATIMLGYPNETRDTVKDTIELFNGLDVMPNPLFFATPYPGTELYDNALAEGKVTADLPEYLRMIGDNDISKLSVNLTDMSDNELIELKEWADNKIRSNFRETTHPARQLVHEFADHVRHYGLVGAIRTGAGKVRSGLA